MNTLSASSFTTCIFGTDEFIENLLGKGFIDTKSKKDMTKGLEVSLKNLRAARMLGRRFRGRGMLSERMYVVRTVRMP